MAKAPRIKGRDLIAALAKAGFSVMRIKGSHHFLKRADGKCTVVPVHAGEIIGPGLLNKILRDCEMTKEQLLGLLGVN